MHDGVLFPFQTPPPPPRVYMDPSEDSPISHNHICMPSCLSPGLLSLVVLVIQNSAVVLMTKQSKMQNIPYHTSTLVLNQELVKLLMCLCIFGWEWRSLRAKRLPGSHAVPHSTATSWSQRPLPTFIVDGRTFLDELVEQVFQRSTWKLLVPAALFTVQNYLLFIALSHLDAVTFQMLSQSKLISAAIFSVMLLEKRLRWVQWAALVLLTFGVYLSQRESGAASSKVAMVPKADASSLVLGAGACILSGVSSSFAGVYFEKVVKSTPPSLAVRNIHLSLFAIPLAVGSMLVIDVAPRYLDGGSFNYWAGYNVLTYALVVVHAIGGLLVAVVVKYTDNILKGFATAVAVVTSGVYMTVFWGYSPSAWFLGGCTLVCLSTVLYQWFEPKRAAPLKAAPPEGRGSMA